MVQSVGDEVIDGVEMGTSGVESVQADVAELFMMSSAS